MPAAARQGDLIGHAPPIPPVVAAAVTGGAVASGAANSIGGKLTSVALGGADAASGSGGGGGGVGGVVTGLIVPRCSGNVFTNGIPAARALIDKAACSLHPPVPLPIVSGSSNVFINGVPAARLGDKIFCGAVILTASGNVFIGGSAGGQTVEANVAMPEESISPLMRDGLLMASAGGPADNCHIQSREAMIAAFALKNAGELIPIGRLDSFFTFNPLGRGLKGLASGVLDMGLIQRNLAVREWSHLVDGYGYGKQALTGVEKGVRGEDRPYQPRSALFRGIEKDGVGTTMGTGVHSVVMGATGLSTFRVIGSRDSEAIGRELPGVFLAVAGGPLISRTAGLDLAEAARMSGGLRRSPNGVLNEADIGRLTKEFVEVGGDPTKLRFNSGRQTSYVDEIDIFRIRGDVLPLENAVHPRSGMSSKATLAHELGHQAHRGTKVPIGAWNDEFRASYWAAKHAPGLTAAERADLVGDALTRAREAGVPVKTNKFIRETLYGY